MGEVIHSDNRTRAAIEIGLILAFGAGFHLSEALLDAKWIFIAGAGLFWIGFVALRLIQDRGWWTRWGLGKANLREAALASAPVIGIGLIGILVYGWAQGRLPPPLHFIWILLLYPV